MQRVTNCLLIKDEKVLLLQKPRRGWWVAPGGKMESGESIKEAVIREFREETGIYLLKSECKRDLYHSDKRRRKNHFRMDVVYFFRYRKRGIIP